MVLSKRVPQWNVIHKCEPNQRTKRDILPKEVPHLIGSVDQAKCWYILEEQQWAGWHLC